MFLLMNLLEQQTSRTPQHCHRKKKNIKWRLPFRDHVTYGSVKFYRSRTVKCITGSKKYTLNGNFLMAVNPHGRRLCASASSCAIEFFSFYYWICVHVRQNMNYKTAKNAADFLFEFEFELISNKISTVTLIFAYVHSKRFTLSGFQLLALSLQ